MPDKSLVETDKWLRDNITEFHRFLKKWITTGDSKFTDIIYQEMNKSIETGIVPPLFSSLLVSAKNFHDEDGLSIYDSLMLVFNSCDEIYRIGIARQIGR